MIDTYHQLFASNRKSVKTMKVIKFLLVFVLIMTSFLSGYMIHKSQDSYNIDDFKKIQNEVKTIQEDTVLSYIVVP